MYNTIEIIIENIAVDKLSIYWGEIYIKTGDVYFPEKGWYDAVSSILDMWSNDIIDFLRNKNTCRLYFMDGPFFIEISSISSNKVELCCVNDDITEMRFIIPCRVLVMEIMNAIAMFLKKGTMLSETGSKDLFHKLSHAYDELARQGSIM